MIVKLFRSLIIASALLGCHTVQSHAQEAQHTVKLQVKIWYKFYLDDQNLDKNGNIIQETPDSITLYYFDNEEVIELDLKPGQKSKAFDYNGPSTFILHQRTGIDQNGEYQFKPVIKARLSPKSTEQQIYAFPNANKQDFKSISIDTSLHAVPENSIRIYNLSPANLVMKIAESTKEIAAYNAKLFRLKGVGDNHLACAQIATEIDGELKRVYRRSWKCPPASRRIHIMYPINSKMTKWRSEIIPLERKSPQTTK